MVSDDYADRIVRIGYELAARVRRQLPAEYVPWLDEQVGEHRCHYRELAVALALHVPDDVAWPDLSAWARGEDPSGPRPLRPCGTVAAAKRHQAHGEPMDDACLLALRAWDSQRKRRKLVRPQPVDNPVGEVAG